MLIHLRPFAKVILVWLLAYSSWTMGWFNKKSFANNGLYSKFLNEVPMK
jgi:hypothetical protein